MKIRYPFQKHIVIKKADNVHIILNAKLSHVASVRYDLEVEHIFEIPIRESFMQNEGSGRSTM